MHPTFVVALNQRITIFSVKLCNCLFYSGFACTSKRRLLYWYSGPEGALDYPFTFLISLSRQAICLTRIIWVNPEYPVTSLRYILRPAIAIVGVVIVY